MLPGDAKSLVAGATARAWTEFNASRWVSSIILEFYLKIRVNPSDDMSGLGRTCLLVVGEKGVLGGALGWDGKERVLRSMPLLHLIKLANRQERRPQLVWTHAACKFSLKPGVDQG